MPWLIIALLAVLGHLELAVILTAFLLLMERL
jgi:hypothetical protein